MASSQSFQKDAIKFNLIHLPQGAEETSIRYSVIVTQHTLQEGEYNYLQLMQQNAFPTGSFFDPMPAQLYGNIKSLENPDEVVVGFVGAYTTVSKTLFIENSELPRVDRGFVCQFEQFMLENQLAVNQYLRADTAWVPAKTWIDEQMNAWIQVIERSCVDCRVYGSTKKPEYWD